MICPNCKSNFSSICLMCGYDPKTNEAKFTTKDLGISNLPHVPMEESHIWLAGFPSEISLDQYFEECINDDDVTPMNDFAKSQGEVFYDHDWVERSFGNYRELKLLIEGHSYCEDYKDKVLKFAQDNKILNANTFIIADASEFKKPKSVKSKEYNIWYVGKFKCSV